MSSPTDSAENSPRVNALAAISLFAGSVGLMAHSCGLGMTCGMMNAALALPFWLGGGMAGVLAYRQATTTGVGRDWAWWGCVLAVVNFIMAAAVGVPWMALGLAALLEGR